MLRMVSCGLALLAAAPSSAHFVWIASVKDGKAVKVVGTFGEPGEPDMKFASKIKATTYTAATAAGVKPLTLTLDAASGEYRGAAPADARTFFGDCDYGTFKRGDGPTGRLFYSAKHVVAPQPGWRDGAASPTARMEVRAAFLDDAVELTVLAKDKPVADAEIKTFDPNNVKGTLKTDANGKAVWKLAACGNYALYVGKTANEAGELAGAKYTVTRDYATLTFLWKPSRLPAMPEAVSSFGAAATGGYAYVYGGHIGAAHSYSTATASGKLWRLNAANPKAWEELPGGPKLQGLALIAHNGKLLRLGGMQSLNQPGATADNKSVATCASFDPQTKKWTDLPAMPGARSSFDAVVSGDVLYVFGGWCMNGAGKEPDWCEHGLKLDLTKPAKWETVAQPFQRRALGVGAAGGKIYVVGGLTEVGEPEATVDLFDPKTAAWSKAAPLPGISRNGFSPAVWGVGDRLFVSPADGVMRELANGGWREVGKQTHARIVHRLVPWNDGGLLVLGGAGGRQGNVAACEVVAPGPAVRTNLAGQ